jgi:hypothetical protein
MRSQLAATRDSADHEVAVACSSVPAPGHRTPAALMQARFPPWARVPARHAVRRRHDGEHEKRRRQGARERHAFAFGTIQSVGPMV